MITVVDYDDLAVDEQGCTSIHDHRDHSDYYGRDGQTINHTMTADCNVKDNAEKSECAGA
jgi:hypothetical protein